MPIRYRRALNALTLGSFLLAGVGRADVVAVVSSKSTVGVLSKTQVAAIFLGKVLRFPGGGAALPLDLVESSTERDQFYLLLDSKSPSQLEAYWSKIIFTGRGQPPRAVANGIELKRILAENPLQSATSTPSWSTRASECCFKLADKLPPPNDPCTETVSRGCGRS